MQITHNSAVEGSAGSMAMSIINKLTGMLSKFLDRLSDNGKKGDFVLFAIRTDQTPEDTPVKQWPYRCKVEFVATKEEDGENDTKNLTDIYNIYLKKIDPDNPNGPGPEAKDYGVTIPKMINGETEKGNESILNDSFEDYFSKKFLEGFEKVTNGEKFQEFKPIQSSTSIKTTLHKVQANDCVDVQLVAIEASTAGAAMIALENVLADDDFVEDIPDDVDASYEIVIQDDGYDVEECEPVEVDMSCILNQILQQLYMLQLSASYVKFNSTGDTVYRCEQIRWACESQIDWFTKTQMRLFNCAENPIALIQSVDTPMLAPAAQDLETMISSLINTLDLYWCNFDRYDQSVITGYINDWRTNVGYRIV